MEVGGVNRLLALAGEIGIGKARVVGEVGRRDGARPASETASTGHAPSPGFEVTISSSARARLAALETGANSSANGTTSTDGSRAVLPALREDRPPVPSEGANPASMNDSSPPPERPAFVAYRRADAAGTSPALRLRV